MTTMPGFNPNRYIFSLDKKNPPIKIYSTYMRFNNTQLDNCPEESFVNLTQVRVRWEEGILTEEMLP